MGNVSCFVANNLPGRIAKLDWEVWRTLPHAVALAQLRRTRRDHAWAHFADVMRQCLCDAATARVVETELKNYARTR